MSSAASAGEGSTREWDADAYHRVAGPQTEWARGVIERLDPRPGESVLDAGCGSGRVTAMLAERIGSRGRLVAVDGSASMAAKAREQLGRRARVVHADLLRFELPEDERVDAVFSNATFHWIDDHEALFARVHSWLRAGGRLEAQCGGEGNVAGFLEHAQRVATREPFSSHLGSVADEWSFQAPAPTEQRLRAAGFEEARAWLEAVPTVPPEPRSYLETVCLSPHLARLPEDLQSAYVEAVLEEWGPQGTLDYVRLNISARSPASPPRP